MAQFFPALNECLEGSVITDPSALVGNHFLFQVDEAGNVAAHHWAKGHEEDSTSPIQACVDKAKKKLAFPSDVGPKTVIMVVNLHLRLPS